MKIKRIKKKSEYEVTLKLSQDELESLQYPIINYSVDETFYSSFAEIGLPENSSALKFVLTIKKLTDKLSKVEIEK